MKIIKLSAIDSTNSFLKELERKNDQENYTTVVANAQTKGRGQMHTKWASEPYKNLTFSTLINLKKLKTSHSAYLSFAISLAIFDILQEYDIPNLKIKWPNDILSGNQKICGILIENTISKHRIINSIAGIGLNVNQERFDNNLHATSMIHFLKKETSLDALLQDIVKNIKCYIQYIELEKFAALKALYLQNLYKVDIPTAFKDLNGHIFMGIIKDVTDQGTIILELEDESLKEFDLKEISLARA
ncbi:biotin--[acetyl-CoA-carboxylase] ligase [Flavobacteriaceae bacterium S356]|uniref:Biotin--[acetyl-CoA-carboxylase] ligase n=1 Tax=Asprobacillus argus TaxID=3076534 RepID=A0ABU3LGM5_9FLAO|nr:biotin--[acetyl-CoA-carboxylase] ligase [Flavobacteriaceae bacterium S356]